MGDALTHVGRLRDGGVAGQPAVHDDGDEQGAVGEALRPVAGRRRRLLPLRRREIHLKRKLSASEFVFLPPLGTVEIKGGGSSSGN